MNKLLVASLSAALMSAGGFALAAVDGKDTHTMHSKQMKSDTGVKDGEEMMDANQDGMISKEEYSTQNEKMWDQMAKDKNGMATMKDMHTMHTKQMKNDTGTKDGDLMMDANQDGRISKNEYSTQSERMWDQMAKDKNGTASMVDMHTMHTRQMKNDAGVKDGEMMKNNR